MNTEVVNILISIDKNVDKILKKYSTENKTFNSLSESYPKFSLHRETSKYKKKIPLGSIQQDRRERRTLRAKVNSILNSLPEVCKTLSKKEKKIMLDLKKKKLETINQIREKLNKDQLYPDDISLDTSFDVYGNIKPKIRELSIPLTPRSALRSKLTATELDMLKEDPVYFIQNEKYKYKIKLDEDENWERLLDGEKPKKHKTQEFKLNTSKNPNKKKIKVKNFESDFHKNQEIETKVDQNTKKMQNFSASQEKIKIKTQQSRIIGENFNVQAKSLASKTSENLQKYQKRLEKIQKMQEKEREIEEKIIKFEKEAKKAEELHMNRLRDKALRARMGLGKDKDKLNSISRQTAETFVEKGRFK